MISSCSILFMKPRTVSLCMQSPDDIKASQVSAQNKTGVSTVQDADLALLAGVTSGTTMTLTPAFLNGELVLQARGALDDPDAEHFTDIRA